MADGFEQADCTVYPLAGKWDLLTMYFIIAQPAGLLNNQRRAGHIKICIFFGGVSIP